MKYFVLLFAGLLFSQSTFAHSCDRDLRQLFLESHPKHSAPAGLAVAVAVVRDGKVLFNRRASGFWGLLGGKYEEADCRIEDCARREALEESGLRLKNLRFAQIHEAFVNEQGKKYFTAILVAEADGVPEVLEPTKASEWAWFAWNQLPSPIFQPTQQLIDEGFNPFAH